MVDSESPDVMTIGSFMKRRLPFACDCKLAAVKKVLEQGLASTEVTSAVVA